MDQELVKVISSLAQQSYGNDRGVRYWTEEEQMKLIEGIRAHGFDFQKLMVAVEGRSLPAI